MPLDKGVKISADEMQVVPCTLEQDVMGTLCILDDNLQRSIFSKLTTFTSQLAHTIGRRALYKVEALVLAGCNGQSLPE